MDINESKNLTFRRQYLLVPERIECPFAHQVHRITDKYTLYAHRDLLVSHHQDQDNRLILLGDIFDFEQPQKDNTEILEDLSAAPGLKDLSKMVGKYSGRYVIILVLLDEIFLIHDATASRKVYYSLIRDDPWFASQPHLLARVMGLKKTSNPSKLAFYKSNDFICLNHSNLGDTTYYDEIFQLIPNHYFNVNNGEVVRYWPNKQLIQMPFGAAVEKGAVMVKGYLEAIEARYKIMLPVTSGSDSRLLMSGTRSFREKIVYYINLDQGLSELDLDVRIPRKLLGKLGLDFKVFHLNREIDESFKKVYFENNPIASKKYLPHIYNYHLHYPDRVNLPGNIASAPWGVYQMNAKKVTIEELIRYYGVQKHAFARNYYQRWWEGCRQLCENCNLNVINLFYWEERISNWGNQISIDKDIAQEEFNPFNSRLLNEIFLSLPLACNNEPDKKIHEAIILKLWPELMRIPFNPSFRTKLQRILARLGIFTATSTIYYRLIKKHLVTCE
jgi:hypothetical protein